ncbi:MAG: proline iminopeptidase-family hydrolase [Actinomycetota bacterium]
MADEGFIDLEHGRVWYRRSGGGDRRPILLLHGGPGAAAYYLEPLEERLAEHRPVVVYDQLGCGRSDQPDDTSLWTLDHFTGEVDRMREALGLDDCHLLGQSWGGWLSIDYLCRGTEGIRSVVLASTSASMPLFGEECRKLMAALPAPHGEVLLAGDRDDPRYPDAEMAFYTRHLCRLDPWPECMVKTAESLDGNPVYNTMNGPNEFTLIGNLKDWTREADLHRIAIPTLLTYGRHDELGEPCANGIKAGVPHAEMHCFEESSHVAHVEEADAYAATVEEFLRRHD